MDPSDLRLLPYKNFVLWNQVEMFNSVKIQAIRIDVSAIASEKQKLQPGERAKHRVQGDISGWARWMGEVNPFKVAPPDSHESRDERSYAGT